MKFHRVIGKIDAKKIQEAEKRLSIIFAELGIKPDNVSIGAKLGGDPLLFMLVVPMQHIATANIPTAGTNGIRYFWNPDFVLSLEPMGLRIVCAHEAWHAIYMHPARRGVRHPRLWNIAVDFIVNAVVMDTLRKRNRDPHTHFEKYLGKYITLEQTIKHFQNPLDPISGLEFDITPVDDTADKIELPKPGEDRTLTEKEEKEIKRLMEGVTYYYADPNLADDMLRPEKIYDMLYKACPKCPKCGKLGVYSGIKANSSDEQCDHEHNIFDDCDVLDDHMDSEETQERMSKKISDAIRSAKDGAGDVPGALEDELGLLTAPKIRWQDFVRTRIIRSRVGNTKNDWTRFKSRPLFAGILTPKKTGHQTRFGALLDTSGSMSKDDMAYVVSQLAGLDERSEGTIVCGDCSIYWDKAIKLRRMRQDDLLRIKPIGRGGTMFSSFFSDYEKHIGQCDFLLVLSDMGLMDEDVANMIDPGIPVYWICSSGIDFKPPFGRLFDLRN